MTPFFVTTLPKALNAWKRISKINCIFVKLKITGTKVENKMYNSTLLRYTITFRFVRVCNVDVMQKTTI